MNAWMTMDQATRQLNLDPKAPIPDIFREPRVDYWKNT